MFDIIQICVSDVSFSYMLYVDPDGFTAWFRIYIHLDSISSIPVTQWTLFWIWFHRLWSNIWQNIFFYLTVVVNGVKMSIFTPLL